MQKLILFRQQIESLNDEELQQCMASFGGNEVETLFEDLFEELTHNKMDNLNKMNSIISKTKQCRKPKTINTNNNNNNNNDDDSVQISIKLNELPNVMLSEISSFLEFSDQLQFEKADRAIFIGSRSSTKPIHSLNEEYFMKLIEFCGYNKREDIETYLHKFRVFNSLTIPIDPHLKCLDLFYFDRFDNLFTNIQQLTIRGVGAFNMILSLLTERYDLSNTKAVRLINNENECTDPSWKSTNKPIYNGLISMMTRNSKLEYFECYNAIAFTNDNYDFLRTVKGFAAHSMEYSVMANMCLSICDLQSLHIDADQAHAIIPYISNYNLKELCLKWRISDREKWRKYGFKIFEQNMKCLERIYFDMSSIGDVEVGIDMETLRIWINKTMKTLKYICFDLYFSDWIVCDILDALIKSLGNVKKHRLKLQFMGIDTNRNMYDGIIYIKLKKLISILSQNCDHWMIIYSDFECEFRGVELYNFVELMEKEYDITYTERSLQRAKGLVITNKGCNMNGYHANWLMECGTCHIYE